MVSLNGVNQIIKENIFDKPKADQAPKEQEKPKFIAFEADKKDIKLYNHPGQSINLEGYFGPEHEIIRKDDGSIFISKPDKDMESIIQDLFPGAKMLSKGNNFEKDPMIAGLTRNQTNIVFQDTKGQNYLLTHDSSRGCFGPLNDTATIKPVSAEEAQKLIAGHQEKHVPKEEKPDIFNKPLTDPKDLFIKKEVQQIKGYQVTRSSNGTISVDYSNRKEGLGYREAIVDIFKDAKNISFGPVINQHPFTSMNFEVDGQKYNLSQLTGGIVASFNFTITPEK